MNWNVRWYNVKSYFEGWFDFERVRLRWIVVFLLLFILTTGVYVKVLVELRGKLNRRLEKLHRYQILARKNREVEERHRRLTELYDLVIGMGTIKAETPSVASASLQERLYKMASDTGVSLDRFNMDKVEDLGNGIKYLSMRVILSGWLENVVDLLYALETNKSPFMVVDSFYIKAFTYGRKATPINCTLKLGAFYMESHQ